MNTRFTILIDLAIFQSAWFACVLATLSPFPRTLPLAGLALVLARVLQARRLKQVLPFLLACAILGIVGDALLVKLGFLAFTPYPNLWGAPLWMVVLWLNFGLMLHPLFSWFIDNCLRSMIGFSLGGLVAYYSGHMLGVLSLLKDWQSALAVATEWTATGIVLHYLHIRFSLKKATS
jgi:hypothetical protein